MAKKTLATVQLHSVVDIITNSSTELFCTVEGSSEEAIQDVVNTILEQFGCEACSQNDGLRVYPIEEEWNDELGEFVSVEGQFGIEYEYGCKPCKLIRKKLEETLTVVKFTEEE
jgi:hypothetical protein